MFLSKIQLLLKDKLLIKLLSFSLSGGKILKFNLINNYY